MFRLPIGQKGSPWKGRGLDALGFCWPVVGMLTEIDIAELTQMRRDLHRKPEVSGEERETAATVRLALSDLRPDRIVSGLGGYGIAAVFEGRKPGPTVMIRCELDALPIEDLGGLPWTSEVPGKGHLCGHDGHMVMVLGLARLLARQRPACGRAVLLFQPSEEDGRGARAVAADPVFAQIAPDWAFAIHNLPGVALGEVAIREGLMNPASVGLQITLTGKTAHAAEPETGVSPAIALARLIPDLDALGAGGVMDTAFQLSTVTYAQLGVPSFGISPGEATINVTLRAATDTALDAMVTEAKSCVSHAAKHAGLSVGFDICDAFAASINAREAVAVVQAAAGDMNLMTTGRGVPMRASEDFGVFGHTAKGAMICLGSGEDHPALHNPDFDFPDDLIPIGTALFARIVRNLLS